MFINSYFLAFSNMQAGILLLVVVGAFANPVPDILLTELERRSVTSELVDEAFMCRPVPEGHLTMFGILLNAGKIYMSYFNGATWVNTDLGNVHSEVVVSGSNPNGLAYDRNTGMLLYADVSMKILYNFNPRTGISRRLGNLTGQAGGAACKNGNIVLLSFLQEPICENKYQLF